MHALPQETFKTTNKKDEKRTFPCRVIVKMIRKNILKEANHI